MSSIALLRLGGLASLALLVQPDSAPAERVQSLRQVATLRTARAAHTATTLPSGSVLVSGGLDRAISQTAELYDPGG